MTHYIPIEYPVLVKRVRKFSNAIKTECCPVQLGCIILYLIRIMGGVWKGDTKLAKTAYILGKYVGLVKNGFNVIDVFGPIDASYETWVKKLSDLGLVRVYFDPLSHTRTFALSPKGLRFAQRIHEMIAHDNLDYLIRGILFPQQTSTLIDLAYTETLHPNTCDRSRHFSKDRFVENRAIILRTLLYNILRYLRIKRIEDNPVVEPLEISETLVVKNIENQLFQEPSGDFSDLKDHNSDLSVYLQSCNIYNTSPSRTCSRGRAASFNDIVTACTRIGYFQAQLHKPDTSNDETVTLRRIISEIRKSVERNIRYISKGGLLKTKRIGNSTFYLITARKYLDSETNYLIRLAAKDEIDKMRKKLISTLREPESWDPYKLNITEELKLAF